MRRDVSAAITCIFAFSILAWWAWSGPHADNSMRYFPLIDGFVEKLFVAPLGRTGAAAMLLLLGFASVPLVVVLRRRLAEQEGTGL